MSRKPKIIPPINGSFCDILSAIASGAGAGRLGRQPVQKKPRKSRTIKASKAACLVACAAIQLSIATASETIVGLWRAESDTNSIVKFQKDGSFHMESANHIQGKELGFPVNGSYKIGDTNHIILEVVPNAAAPSDKIPFTVLYQISGGELWLQTIDIEPEVVKYRLDKIAL
jgi:hypothetical protein